MSDKSIRIGQLIAPFGPGSLYTDKNGVTQIICGLDHWFKRTLRSGGLEKSKELGEFIINDVRLSRLLRVDTFFSPPDYRSARMSTEAPPNSYLTIPTLRFPRWYRNSHTRELRRFNLETRTTYFSKDKGKWVPVRFIAVCEGGHISDFPWKSWSGCVCSSDDNLELIDMGGSDLSSIIVRCTSCSQGKKGRNLSGVTKRSSDGETAFFRAGIRCTGERPWLGDGANECDCSHPLVAALINQTNIYFPKVASAISLPDLDEKNDQLLAVLNYIEQSPYLGQLKMMWRLNATDAVATAELFLNRVNIAATREIIEGALKSLFDNERTLSGSAQPSLPEGELLAFRRSEYNVLRQEVNDKVKYPNLRVIPAKISNGISPYFDKIHLVERLREVRVFHGFSRLQDLRALESMPDSAIKQLYRDPPAKDEQWLPAIEVFGEGLYLELSEDRLSSWLDENAKFLEGRLQLDFLNRLIAQPKILSPLHGENLRAWAARYLMLHSLSHILINEMVFECGYSTSALRERLYVSSDPVAPMAGIMIYTAAGDSEGTLGGLVQLGRSERFEGVLVRAVNRASWCSADPICSERIGGHGSRLTNLAACQACALLPETACESINNGLDRALVVGNPENRSLGFFSSLIGKMYCY